MNTAAQLVSIVVATYNRGPSLKTLLDDLAAQSYALQHLEVIVVDDGSKEPVATWIGDYASSVPYTLIALYQANAGAAAARHRGVEEARGDIVIITDDDMSLHPDFVAAHVRAHAAGATVVLGQICSAPGIETMPVFERFHAHQLERFADNVVRGRVAVRGVHVCTGNLSFRRADYLAVGGFDRTLGRSEDRELGVRLERGGGRLAFAPDAKCTHASDHADLKVWLRRAYNYGVYDRRIAQKHPDEEMADPWRFFFLVSPLSRPWLLLSVGFPRLGACLTQWSMQAALVGDAHGFGRAARLTTTLAYGLEYFRGMREDAGSWRQSARDLRGYLKKRRALRGARRLLCPAPR